MKFVHRLSSPLISGSVRVYDLIARFRSLHASRGHGRHPLARLPGHAERDFRKLHFDTGSRGPYLYSGYGLDISNERRPIQAIRMSRIREASVAVLPDGLCNADLDERAMTKTTVCADTLLQQLERNPPKDLSLVRWRQRDKAIALIRDEALLLAAYSFDNHRLVGIDGEHRLCLSGETLPLTAELPKRGELTAIGCGACTLGPRLEARVRRLFADKRVALALALDAVGNELLHILGRRLQGEMLAEIRRLRLIPGQVLQVGTSEFDFAAQAAVLRMGGAKEIGVTLHRSNLLLPQKSTSVALVAGQGLPRQSRTHYRRSRSL
ncbi:MAG: hypothetical protein P8178_04075 [Candidatus Thiodiazotropha sp.]